MVSSFLTRSKATSWPGAGRSRIPLFTSEIPRRTASLDEPGRLGRMMAFYWASRFRASCRLR
jgi:hypothetical protein